MNNAKTPLLIYFMDKSKLQTRYLTQKVTTINFISFQARVLLSRYWAYFGGIFFGEKACFKILRDPTQLCIIETIPRFLFIN